MDTALIAKATLRAAQIRESSWEGQLYRIPCINAARVACEELKVDRAMAMFIGLNLIGCWNDTLQWAKENA